MIANRKLFWVVGCVILFIMAFLGGYIWKKNVYVDIEETDMPYNNPNLSSYTIIELDSEKIQIASPQAVNGDLVLKLKCNDNVFLNECSPIFIKGYSLDKKKMFEFQYALEYERNQIILPKKKPFVDNFIIRIGYFKYADLVQNENYFYCVSYKIEKDSVGKFVVQRYRDDDPKRMYREIRLKTIVEVETEPIHTYVYQYDIDSFFNGFKDKNNQLLNSRKTVIFLNNKSRYEGSIKNGYFEGDGATFYDNILKKEYKDVTFVHGNIERDSSINNNIFIKIVERPLLSYSYPSDGCYRTDDYFVDGINIKRVHYICRKKESYPRNSHEISDDVLNGEKNDNNFYRLIITFDKQGNKTGHKWENVESGNALFEKEYGLLLNSPAVKLQTQEFRR